MHNWLLGVLEHQLRFDADDEDLWTNDEISDTGGEEDAQDVLEDEASFNPESFARWKEQYLRATQSEEEEEEKEEEEEEDQTTPKAPVDSHPPPHHSPPPAVVGIFPAPDPPPLLGVFQLRCLPISITPHLPAFLGIFQPRCFPTSLLVLPPSLACVFQLRCSPTSLLIVPPSSALSSPAPVLADIIPRRPAFLGFCQPICSASASQSCPHAIKS
ncbi:hypothetical protein B0H14DRAFT_3527730 [Mycena olivaceomarginata]|nr:hypothetical protein B0H14DRAFT_3527730 [Mycena olivaceomarginata]